MEERVQHLGGRLRVESEPGRGTIVSFELPLSNGVSATDQSGTDQPLAHRVENQFGQTVEM
jgi:signal transduction histidine kinase